MPHRRRAEIVIAPQSQAQRQQGDDRWLRKHLLDNNVDPDQHHLVLGAVEDLDGEAMFVTGHASEWYGQYVVNPDGTGRFDTYENAKRAKLPPIPLIHC